MTNAAGGANLAEELTQDSAVVIANLPAGANVNISVSARNTTAESQPTAPSPRPCRDRWRRRSRPALLRLLARAGASELPSDQDTSPQLGHYRLPPLVDMLSIGP